MRNEYESTAEGRMWHAVLWTYYIDAASVSEQNWNVLLQQAKSDWTKQVCSMIDLNHKFFLANLEKVRANKSRISFISNTNFGFRIEE